MQYIFFKRSRILIIQTRIARNTFGDKTSAKNLAIASKVPVVIGSDEAFATPAEAEAWINDPSNPITFPVIVKAAMGGGGRGIRIVPKADDLDHMFRLASNEALNAFGDGRCFVEKYVDKPRHIEVQCLGDGTGNVIHLYDRDCSVQRRHQKVIETAPATGLSKETRENIFNDAVRLLKANNYRLVNGLIKFYSDYSILTPYSLFLRSNAGTVEFLVDRDGNHYFMEVNPRVQVEHTITEEITGIDIVQSQIMIASGKTLNEIGLSQDSIQEPTSYAMQCRVVRNGANKCTQKIGRLLLIVFLTLSYFYLLRRRQLKTHLLISGLTLVPSMSFGCLVDLAL